MIYLDEKEVQLPGKEEYREGDEAQWNEIKTVPI